MTWLVASAEQDDLAAVRAGSPALWRELRRYNAPVQLAVTAAREVAAHARTGSEAALVSLAPCQAGSPELHRWVRAADTGSSERMNPTHTLHSVDNLGLSVLSIALGNHAWGLGLGGAPGMFWSALELTAEREEAELIVFGGDQHSGHDGSGPEGVALLFSREPAPYAASGRTIKLLGIERRRRAEASSVIANAAAGARAMLGVLRARPRGRLSYDVPVADGDGIDDIQVAWEIG